MGDYIIFKWAIIFNIILYLYMGDYIIFEWAIIFNKTCLNNRLYPKFAHIIIN